MRATLVLEADALRTVRTDLLDGVSDVAGRIPVASTRGFPEGGAANSYILVDNEWMYYSKRDDLNDCFTVTRRGQRGTVAAVHAAGAPVRCGATFTRSFYLPAWRSEDPVGAPGSR